MCTSGWLARERRSASRPRKDTRLVLPGRQTGSRSRLFTTAGPSSPVLELLVMPALGGPSRRIASGWIPWWAGGVQENGTAAPFWSPDGKWLLWSQLVGSDSPPLSIHAAPAGGGEAHRLLDPPTSGTPGEGDLSPAVSPGGRELVWIRCMESHDCDLCLAGFQDGRLTGTPRQLTHDHKLKRSPLWTNDGKEIVYIAGEITSELSMYRVRASGGEPRRIEGVGANAASLTMAAKQPAAGTPPCRSTTISIAST